MMIRKLMILLAAVLAPIAFAGATADITRGWVRKWIEFTAAMIASKLLLVIILSLGVSVLNGAGQNGGGATQTATQLAGGSLILLLGGLAPWVAIRMFHFAGDSLYAAHSVARESAAGAQSVIHGPQKVAALQGTRALPLGWVPLARRRLRRRLGRRSWRRYAAGSPATRDGRRALRRRCSEVPGWLNGRAGMAASTGGAAAATSAAVPVAGALVAGRRRDSREPSTPPPRTCSPPHAAGQPAQPTRWPGRTWGPARRGGRRRPSNHP